MLYLEDIINELTIINLVPFNILYHQDTEDLDLIYEIELTDMQTVDLNLFFQNYIPIQSVNKSFTRSYPIQIKNHQQNSLNYNLCGNYNYIIDPLFDDDTKIILSTISNGTTTYQFRVYRLDDNVILAESPILNYNISTIYELEVPISISCKSCILELHIKVYDTSGVSNIESAQLNIYT